MVCVLSAIERQSVLLLLLKARTDLKEVSLLCLGILPSCPFFILVAALQEGDDVSSTRGSCNPPSPALWLGKVSSSFGPSDINHRPWRLVLAATCSSCLRHDLLQITLFLVIIKVNEHFPLELHTFLFNVILKKTARNLKIFMPRM